jgi:hypothetical protein
MLPQYVLTYFTIKTSTYSVDTGNFEVVDTHTFIADLNKSIKWDHPMVKISRKRLYMD